MNKKIVQINVYADSYHGRTDVEFNRDDGNYRIRKVKERSADRLDSIINEYLKNGMLTVSEVCIHAHGAMTIRFVPTGVENDTPN